MKIALCLYGYFNNRTDDQSGEKGFRYLEKQILGFNPDVFIHSWDLENKDRILELYSPKDYDFDEQINFNKIAVRHGIDEAWINYGFKRNRSRFKNCTINASLSFYYSRMISIDLKILHELDNMMKYDCVIVSRFDAGHRSPIHRGYCVSDIPFNPHKDMDFLYSAMWDQLNAGYTDQWFYSCSDNIDKLAAMYMRAKADYFKVGSEYYNTLTTSWPDSNYHNEFSNEFLNYRKAKLPAFYPRWQIDAHDRTIHTFGR
jgi:hypothetical protein